MWQGRKLGGGLHLMVVVHKVGSRCGLKLTASGLANGPLAWTSCTAKTERVGGMVGGYQKDKGTHPHGKGEKRSRHNVRKPSEMVDSFCQLFRYFPVTSRLSKEMQMLGSLGVEPTWT
jgi:hypothetical protein